MTITGTIPLSDTVLVVAQQPGADFLRVQIEAGRSDYLPSLRARAYDGLGIVAVPPLDDAGRRIGYWTARGLRVGGAGFSAKHANFVENLGDATTADIFTAFSRITFSANTIHGNG